jgi:hypothetical protein
MRHRLVHSRRLHVPITVLHPPIQIHLLQHCAEPIASLRIPRRPAVLAHHILLQPMFVGALARFVRVLDVEDGLPRVDERVEGVAFLVLDALLVYGEVDDGEDGGDDVAGVFEAEGEV